MALENAARLVARECSLVVFSCVASHDDTLAAPSFDCVCQSVEEARARHPGVNFEVVDVLQAGAMEALRRRRGWTVVFVDINGNRELETVLLVLRLCVKELGPRAVFVKSRALHQALLQRAMMTTTGRRAAAAVIAGQVHRACVHTPQYTLSRCCYCSSFSCEATVLCCGRIMKY